MGRELQKKKNRSSISKVKHKPKSKRVSPLGNAIIAANWDSTKTLSQNYRNLGLTSRLNTVTGGTEISSTKTSTASKLAISGHIPTTLAPTEARIERDPETGKILHVIHEHAKKLNPLNDPLNDDDEDDVQELETPGEKQNTQAKEIVKQLEEQASMIPEKKVRKQSQREQEWCERLVTRWGDNFGQMTKDRRLNPMQQTETDISKRIKKWRSENGHI